MTAQIANAIDSVLKPQGVGVVLKAEHFCMTARGIMKPGTDLVTSRMLGVFRDSAITPRVPQRNNPAAILAVSSSSTLESQADVDGHAVVRMPMHALMSASSAKQSSTPRALSRVAAKDGRERSCMQAPLASWWRPGIGQPPVIKGRELKAR